MMISDTILFAFGFLLARFKARLSSLVMVIEEGIGQLRTTVPGFYKTYNTKGIGQVCTTVPGFYKPYKQRNRPAVYNGAWFLQTLQTKESASCINSACSLQTIQMKMKPHRVQNIKRKKSLTFS